MFWTDWGKEPRIEKASMDGSGRIPIVRTNLGWPNGITIDKQSARIVWADAKIEVSSTRVNNECYSYQVKVLFILYFLITCINSIQNSYDHNI